jgi:hypothetical protein
LLDELMRNELMRNDQVVTMTAAGFVPADRDIGSNCLGICGADLERRQHQQRLAENLRR